MTEFAEVNFISRSLGESAIKSGETQFSSQYFELELVKAMSTLVPMHVFNVRRAGKTNSRVQANVEFSAVGWCGLFSPLLVLLKVISRKQGRRVAIVTTGYLPVEMLVLAIAKMFGVSVFSFIYDTHVPALARMGACKKSVARAYFGFGFWLVRKLHGIIVLNETFIRERGLRVPFIKTRVGAVALERHTARKIVSPSSLTLLFAGTINADNGVKIILDAFNELKDPWVNLVFCGDGELLSDVIKACESDRRIVWLGRISDPQLNLQIAASDYLICLRDPASLSCAFSFPSKLIKFMASGKPVIVNRFPGLSGNCDEYLRVLREYSSVALVDEILSLDRQSDQRLAEAATRIVRSRHNWIDIAREVVDFMKRAPFNRVQT